MTDPAALNGVRVHQLMPRGASLGETFLGLTEGSAEYRPKGTVR